MSLVFLESQSKLMQCASHSLILTPTSDGPPASDPAVDATEEGAPRCRQADWSDIVGEVHRRCKFQKSNVIIITTTLVVGVGDDLANCQRDLVRVG